MSKEKYNIARCEYCGNLVRFQDAFCAVCGTRNTGWTTDYEGKCGNCHAKLGSTDQYCRVCGTKRNEGAFLPYKNRMECIYGPMPVKRLHTCKSCGYAWENKVMIDYDKYCPKCGQLVEVKEEE